MREQCRRAVEVGQHRSASSVAPQRVANAVLISTSRLPCIRNTPTLRAASACSASATAAARGSSGSSSPTQYSNSRRECTGPGGTGDAFGKTDELHRDLRPLGREMQVGNQQAVRPVIHVRRCCIPRTQVNSAFSMMTSSTARLMHATAAGFHLRIRSTTRCRRQPAEHAVAPALRCRCRVVEEIVVADVDEKLCACRMGGEVRAIAIV